MAERINLEILAEDINNTNIEEEVWSLLFKFTAALDFDAFSYYHNAPPGSQDFSSKYFISIGFDEAAAAEHRRTHNHFNSPFTSRSNPITEPLFWSDVLKTIPLTEEQKDSLMSLYCRGDGTNGIVVPVFGPNSRNGCVVLRFSSPDCQLNRENVHKVSLAAYLAHLQFCRIRAKNVREAVHLTTREKEVLTWVARGKSNSVIADIVGISQHTVNGYLRRIYLKTRTSDRTSAAMRAIGDALIEY
mgnify:CR=1 FL=1